MTGRRMDERALWALIAVGATSTATFTARDAVRALGIPPRRAAYLFRKWSRLGLYDWGVVMDRGWTYGRSSAYTPPRGTPVWECYLGRHHVCQGYACPCCARAHARPCGAIRWPDRTLPATGWCTLPADHAGVHDDQDVYNAVAVWR